MSDRYTRLLDLIDEAVKADPGYDQSQRWDFLDKANRRMIPGMEADCSAMTMALVWLAGYPIPDANIANPSMPCWTGNVPQLMAAATWPAHNSVGWSVDAIQRSTTPGDVLLGDGHVMIKHRSGLWWSMNIDENGCAMYGRRGDQTGGESSLRPLWARHGGWLAFYTAPDKGGISYSSASAPNSPAQSLSKFVDAGTIKAMQHVLGVTPDGIAGPLTVGALIERAGFNSQPPRLDTPSNTVKRMQKFMNQFVGAKWCHYARLDVDGVLGVATATALHNYLFEGNGGFTHLDRTVI